MKIIVCVKQVARIYLQDGYDPKTKDIVTDGLVYILNPYDENAVEEALRQKEKTGMGEVTVITIGPSRAEEILRWCLSLGVDSAIHVVNDTAENHDPWVIASDLAGLIREMDYDLLFFGRMAIDDELGQIGTFTAELLDTPVITAVAEIESIADGKVRVKRALERGNRERVTCMLPAALTIDKTVNQPRYPTFPARKAAKVKAITKIDINSIPAQQERNKIVTRFAAPKLRPKKMLTPDSSMTAAERMKFVMMGGMVQKKGDTVAGDPKQIVSGIIDFLKEKKVIE